MSKWQKLFAFLVFIGMGAFCFSVVSNVQHGRNLAEKRSSPQGQLPDTVVPLGYDLTLRINPQKSGFSGVVKIELQIHKAVQEIWLHGEDIHADEVTLYTHDNGKVKGKAYDLAYKEMGHSGVVHLTTKHIIKPQTATLEIHYTAPFDTQLTGLYKVKDNQQPYIFSQFEAIGARKAFPSFDEPRFKVPFALTLEVKQGDKAFTNTPQIGETLLDDGYKQLAFATTKPLPTYLLAFAVGDLDVVEHEAIAPSDIRQKSVPLRGITVKGKSDQLSYALNATASALETLESYFGTPYPYEKLDLVAVPDFAAAGMENAGLITYREQVLLLGDSPSYAQQRLFARVHTHELAHQWFGNLVTMRWWDDIWLNEAFATWMTHKALNQWKPEFEFSRSLIRRGHKVMDEDSLVNTRQVREPITSNDMIINAFDRITYLKGGAVLQMFERFIGPEVFREGVQYHLERFAFGHADAYEFIESFEKVSGKTNLKAAFFSFLTQPGVPEIELDWRCVNDSVVLNIKQSRYLPLGTHDNNKPLWNLPICVTMIDDDPFFRLDGENKPNRLSGQNTKPFCSIVTEAEQTIKVQRRCPLAIMPNNEGNGYYRFRYDQDQWQALLQQLPRLSPAEKYSVANNLAAALKAGDVDASFYIKAVKPFTQESEWDLVTTPVDELKFIADYIANPQEKEQLAAYLDILYRPLLDKLGLQADTEQDETAPVATSLLRRNIVRFMALRVKEPALRQQLVVLAKAFINYQDGVSKVLEDKSLLNPDLVSTALSVAVQELGHPFFKALKTKIGASVDSTFRQQGLMALGAAIEPELAEEVRSMVLSLSIKNNERGYLLRSQMSHVEHQKEVYQWLKTYFAVMSTVLPESVMAFTPRVADGFCSEAEAKDVQDFFGEKTRNIAGAKRHLALALERIRICIAIKNHQSGLQFTP